MEILTKRPDEMLFTDYREHLIKQKQWIKNHKKGQLYYLASEIFYSPEDKRKEFELKSTNPPLGVQLKNIY